MSNKKKHDRHLELSLPKICENPLLSESTPTTDTTAFDAPATFKRKRNTVNRELRDQRRIKTAAEALVGFDDTVQIYGFTKGAFSVIDLITELVKVTGPADLTISTWTAAKLDITRVLEFCESGAIRSARWLTDLTFQRRTPELANRIRDVFGKDAIRVAKVHSKFALISNDKWKIVLQTSMNLNFSPRFENFSVAHDPELYDFIDAIVSEVWNKQSKSKAFDNPHAIEKHFYEDL